MKRLLFCLVFAILFLANLAFSATITVKVSDGVDLKKAIEVSANAGDIVEVPPGIYELPSQINWPSKTNITLRATAEGNSSNVIIQPSLPNTMRFAQINDGVSLNIQDVTIQNFGGVSFANDGGVFWLANNASTHLNLSQTLIKNNKVSTAKNGGVFFINASGVLTTISVNRTIFLGNSAGNGGVANYGKYTWTNVVASGNSATTGGGVAYFGDHRWINVKAIANSGGSYGGVAYYGNHSWINVVKNQN